MKYSALLAPALLLAGPTQAAVDVSGFTVENGSLPYGLIALTLVLAGLAMRSGLFAPKK